MQRVLKWLAISLPLAAVIVLIVLAASGSFFFVNQWLESATAVYIEDDGYAFHFYKDNTAVTVVTAFHRVGEVVDGQAPVLVEIIPHEGYKIDSLYLEISQLQPPQALTLVDSDYEFERTDYEKAVGFGFPGLGAEPSETLSLGFNLDVASLDAATPEKISLFISVTAHENSVFKLVKYSGSTTIQVEVPELD